MSATNLNIRTDKEIKNQAEEIFNELGLNMTTAINMFLRTVVREYGIPFELKLDVLQETAAEAALESKKMLSDLDVTRVCEYTVSHVEVVRMSATNLNIRTDKETVKG